MSMSPCLHFSIIPCLNVHVSTFPYFNLHVSMSACPCHHVSGIQQTANETNGIHQLPFVFCKRKTEMANIRLFAANGNGSLFSSVGKQKTVTCDRCISKPAHLWPYVSGFRSEYMHALLHSELFQKHGKTCILYDYKAGIKN